MQESAQSAYDAYHGYLHTRDQAHTWVWWADLAEEEQQAWRAAAHAAIQEGWKK
jgi:hypothetical protein